MDYRILALPILMSASLLLSGCGGGGDEGSNGGGGGNGGSAAAAIAGLWDVTVDGDIQYQEFTADGLAINWDYDGDDLGDGENCYYKFSIPFDHISGDQFDGFGEVVTVSVNGNQVTITDFEGTFTYPRLEGLSTTDFNLCN